MKGIGWWLDEEDAQIGMLAEHPVDEELIAAPNVVPGFE
jgi:hypothetical protein